MGGETKEPNNFRNCQILQPYSQSQNPKSSSAGGMLLCMINQFAMDPPLVGLGPRLWRWLLASPLEFFDCCNVCCSVDHRIHSDPKP